MPFPIKDLLSFLNFRTRLALAASILVSPGYRMDAEMVPFVLPWNDTSDTITNISHWSHKPAGKNGYLYANPRGELMSGNERIRLWGVNLTAGACFPTHADADQIAGRMSKFGINVVRFHHLNAPWAGNFSLINYSTGNSRSLSTSNLDKLGYLIHALKQNGIYTNLNMLVSRQFYATDGFPQEIEQLGWKESHAIGHFNDHHLSLQKEFASQLLNYDNPYTGMALKNDPAVATIEILNENSLFKAWFSGDLDLWPAILADQITPIWNDWLAPQYENTQSLKDGWGFIEEPLGSDLLANGDLRMEVISPWLVEQHQGATATATLIQNAYTGGRALRVQVTQTGSESWHIQAKYTPVELIAGQMYTIRAAVRGSNQQPLTMTISQDYSPWAMVDVRQSTTLTGDWQILEQTFIASRSDANLRIIFNGFAKLTGYVDIAGLTLRTGGNIGSIPQGTSLETRNIPWIRLADNDPGAPQEMMHDWFRFLLHREQRYIQEMETHLRDTIGYPGIILSTQMGYAPAEALANLAAADAHAYWSHPVFPEESWDPYNWYIVNESMVNSPSGTIGDLAKRRVKGIPYFISEYQHAFPNTYSTEAPVLIGAYGALQNWDGVYFFNYGNSHDDWARGFFDQYFDTSQHPGNMANLLLGAALFRREDVQPANQVFSYSSPTDQYFNQITGKPDGGWVSGINELPIDNKNALLHRLEIDPGILNDDTGYPPDTNTSNFGSDTAELEWNNSVTGSSFVHINTDKTKALIGFINGRSFDFNGIQFFPGANQQDWLTLGLIAMQGESILSDLGSNCLLIATGECSNTGMQWNEEKNSLISNNWGTAPSLIEVIPADIVLPVQPWRVRVWALDTAGARDSELTVTNSNNMAKFTIGSPYKTLWYEVEIASIPVIHSSIQVESDGEVNTTTVGFTVDQPIDQSRMLLQSSSDLSNWFNLPDASVQWQTSQDSLNATTKVEESHGNSTTKYFRAEILN